MKNIIAVLVAVFAIVLTNLKAVAYEPYFPVWDQEVSSNGAYPFQGMRINTNNGLSFTDIGVRVTGTGANNIRQVFLVESGTGKVVASTSWIYDMQSEDYLELQLKETLIGKKEYLLYGFIQGYPGEEGIATVKVEFWGYGYRSGNSSSIMMSEPATHTLRYGYSGETYIEETNDIGTQVKTEIPQCFASISLYGWEMSEVQRLEFTVDVDDDKGTVNDLRAIVLTDVNGKRLGKVVRVTSESKKQAKIIVQFNGGLHSDGRHTILIRATASKNLDGGKVVFSFNPQGSIANNGEKTRLLFNWGTDDLIPLQTIQVGKLPVVSSEWDDYYDGYYGGYAEWYPDKG